jgi:iron complex transport system substrate-binding protein
VSAATEFVAALGAAKSLVAISHECDWPPSVQHLPRITATPIDPAAPSGVIDAEVRKLQAGGKPVIAVDAAMLERLRPDLILTQSLCVVCAVADGSALDLAALLEPVPTLLSLTGRTLEGVFEDLARLALALDAEEEGRELGLGMRSRLRALAARRVQPAPRVVCIEWLDPVFLAGHWVPDLIAAAGGLDVGAQAGEHSRTTTLEAVRDLAPDLLLIAPCGFGLPRAAKEFEWWEAALRRDGGAPPARWGIPVWLLDGNAYTSRPGPRLVDAAWRISAILRGLEVPGALRMA